MTGGWAQFPQPVCGPRILRGSAARSTASTPRRASSTTGTASSWARTSSGENQWVAQPNGSKDPALRGVPGPVADRLLRIVYKVLLTRGMVGTVVYSVDPETQQLLMGCTS